MDGKNPAHRTTTSGIPLRPWYGPEHLEDWDAAGHLSFPGQFPYNRGP